jgi:hypothetical protein
VLWCQPRKYRPHHEGAQTSSILNPQKIQMFQHLNEDDPEGQLEFCEREINKSDGEANFSSEILFTDVVNFYVNE